MKDKRNYLKIACLIELIYIVGIIIYNIFFIKSKDEVIAVIFMQIISLFITYILYKESKKDIKYLKNNKLKIIACSIYLFIDPVIPGILGFIFLSSLKPKKKLVLPSINNEITKYTHVKSIINICLFIFIMFILPLFKIDIPNVISYIMILAMVIGLNFKELKDNLLIFIKNIKVYLPFVLKRYLIMLLVMFIVTIPVVLINSGKVSTNQQMLNDMFGNSPLIVALLVIFYAPLVEESVFRLSINKLVNKKILFILISGILFGVLHMVDKLTSINDILYIIQYSSLGICLAKAYYDTKNIFVSISMHFIQNFIAVVVLIFS